MLTLLPSTAGTMSIKAERKQSAPRDCP
jgi:hypothetical protein